MNFGLVSGTLLSSGMARGSGLISVPLAELGTLLAFELLVECSDRQQCQQKIQKIPQRAGAYMLCSRPQTQASQGGREAERCYQW